MSFQLWRVGQIVPKAFFPEDDEVFGAGHAAVAPLAFRVLQIHSLKVFGNIDSFSRRKNGLLSRKGTSDKQSNQKKDENM